MTARWGQSYWDGRPRTFLRVGLAVIVASNVASAAWDVWQDQRGPWSHPMAPGFLLDLAGSPWVFALLTIAWVALLFFARAPGRLLAGSVALAVMALLVEADGALNEGPKRHFFAPGLVLLGWLGGLAFARVLAWRARVQARDHLAWLEQHAEMAAVATLAGNYLDAALSKLRHVGPDWANDTTLRSIVLSHHVLGDTSLAGQYAHWVASHAAVSQALSYATLVVQAGACLMLVGRRWRLVAGLAVVAFHQNVQWLAHIGYGPARTVLLLLCLPWPQLADRWLARWPRLHRVFGPHQSPPPLVNPTHLRQTLALALVVVLALVGLARALPVASYAALHHSYGGERAGPRH